MATADDITTLPPGKMHLSRRFICISFILATAFGFYSGRLYSKRVLYDPSYLSSGITATTTTNSSRCSIPDKNVIRPHNVVDRSNNIVEVCHEDDNYDSHDTTCLSSNNNAIMTRAELSLELGANEAYEEAFVHTVMFSHTHPERVGIIGRRKSTALKEVLKHNSVSEVVMFIDEDDNDESVTLSSTKNNNYDNTSPDSFNCSDLMDIATVCDDDKRVELVKGDVSSWFVDDSIYSEQEPFDVLLMDVLNDIHDDMKFAEQLYTNEAFIKSLYDSTSDDGLVVFKLGVIQKSNIPQDKGIVMKWRDQLFSLLETVGFESINFYSEKKDFEKALRMFVVAMKSSENRKYWYENSAEKSLKIHQQVRRTYSGSPALKYFDSSTMQKYQIPHKSIETLYCQSYPELCGSLDFENDRKEENVPISDLEVGMSTIGEGSGRGVFARVDIKKGSILALQETIHPVYCSPGSMKLVYDYSEMQETKYVFNYLDGYGWLTSALGWDSYYVEPNILTFCNHGCNGTYNIDSAELMEYKEDRFFTEQDVEKSDFPSKSDSFYSPYSDRRYLQSEVSASIAVKDIYAGEEIFSDYLFYTLSDAESFYAETQVLKRICRGEEVGLITKSEINESLNRS